MYLFIDWLTLSRYLLLFSAYLPISFYFYSPSLFQQGLMYVIFSSRPHYFLSCHTYLLITGYLSSSLFSSCIVSFFICTMEHAARSPEGLLLAASPVHLFRSQPYRRVWQFYASFSCSWSTTVLTIGGSLWRGRGCLRSLWNWVSAQCTQFRASTTSCGPQSWPIEAVVSARSGCHTMWRCPYPCSSVSTSSAELCFFTVNCSQTHRPGVLVLLIASTLTQDLCSRPSWQFVLALYCWFLWFRYGLSPAGPWGNVKGKFTLVSSLTL